uniref:MADS-box protein AGL42-like isoform X2 n=1 Tax=Erigeron canadensis TaxID=72917 RepID=UPI001CB8DE3C|nr:MADS-box protein AGL42-like isoform X2 [Erigeron canadensis]
MVRGKVELKRIENTTSRQVTFTKRRNGLLKKSCELSVLCDAEVAVIVFSQKGKLYEFSSSNMQETIERYREHVNMDRSYNPNTEVHNQKLKQEAAIIKREIEQLEASQRRFLGQDLVSCSLDELSELDSRLEHTLRTVRARKERYLLEENSRLCQENTSLCQKQRDTLKCSRSSKFSEVETDLFVGLRLSQNA